MDLVPKILDTIAAVAPIIKPVSLPNTIAETIMTKEVGCTLGKIEMAPGLLLQLPLIQQREQFHVKQTPFFQNGYRKVT